ncbi:DUF998 domain-containing protein [Litorisediminicola beolgyonensis]|uniref:DUF998 domain-containing protein n=1 Tax=Litorisediminicola beolgyonensis TaxID=1173614 RepID=A0ABW3ZNG7_9RHOB
MSRHESAEIVARERPELLIFCGVAGLIGTLAPLAMIVWADAVAEHDFIADTISDLARGDHKWIMDLGFYLNAGGLLALAIAAAHAHLGRAGWSIGIVTLALLSLTVVMLGLWDKFHDADYNPPGMTVHTKLSFALGPLYLVGPLLMAQGAGGVRRAYLWLFLASAGLWIAFAAAFKLAPTGYDGILEKVAITMTWLWTVPLGALFISRGLGKRHRITER